MRQLHEYIFENEYDTYISTFLEVFSQYEHVLTTLLEK